MRNRAPQLRRRSGRRFWRTADGRPSSGPMASSAPAVDATVKWFKADKGYGFVELANGQGDAFLHANALRDAGHDSVPAGAKLKVQVGAGAKGAQVTRVIEVDTAGVVERPVAAVGRRAAPAPRRARPVDRGRRDRHGQVVRRHQGLRLRGQRRRRQGRVRAHLDPRPGGHHASGRRSAGQYARRRHAEGPRGDFAVALTGALCPIGKNSERGPSRALFVS